MPYWNLWCTKSESESLVLPLVILDPNGFPLNFTCSYCLWENYNFMQPWTWLGKVVFQHATVILVAHLMMASVTRTRTPPVNWCRVAVTAKPTLRAVDATRARMASGTLMKTIQRVASVCIYKTSNLPVNKVERLTVWI